MDGSLLTALSAMVRLGSWGPASGAQSRIVIGSDSDKVQVFVIGLRWQSHLTLDT